MKHSNKECIHCGTRYTYQSSGWGASEYNHDRYCPDCWKRISKVLKGIPKKFEYRQVGTDEVTYIQLIRWEEKSKNKIQQISPGLICTETGDSQFIRSIRGKDKYEGIKFWLSEWRLSPEYTITKELYWDIENDRPVNGEYYRDMHVQINPNKQYPPKKSKSVQKCDVIPLSEPVGIKLALRSLIEGGHACDVDNTFDVDDTCSVNQIAINNGVHKTRSLDDLSEDEFSDVRKLIYDKYNPSKSCIDIGNTYSKLYLKCESVFCRKEHHNFVLAMEHGNRFSKLLATARVAKARYNWYKSYYHTFKENA